VARYDPAHALGPLFHDVQMSGIFGDSKTFVDARPRFPPAEIVARSRGSDWRAFVERNFELPRPVGAGFRTDPSQTMEQHIAALWPVLTRPPDSADPRSSLIPLPRPYVVPGGRFREVYYWDSYFTMLGLVQSGRTTKALDYLKALETEYTFWMDGARVVALPDGSVLNRYWDDLAEPRPESYREDYKLGQTVPDEQREGLYRNVRASAESGWDFSSRWMRDSKDLRTLETTELIPVDLNSLLYNLERTIAALRTFRGAPGDGDVAQRFTRAAEARRRALLAAAYDSASGFFYDVRWKTGARVTDRPTLAAAAPLYFGLATQAQGRRVAARLERDFLKPGGFVTTLIASGQQWDAPNGWPPLEWLAIEGVRRYGRAELADRAASRWLDLNRRTYRATGKMTEKYDVVDLRRRAGGGEYPTQDGFGWTNGVALALLGRGGQAVRTRSSSSRAQPPYSPAAISRAVISYLKVSGSRLSSRPSSVSACGYMRNGTRGPREPGSTTSCAKL
jgi:alpha,alpha-trehalase